jgi:RNA polymerase sigma-70 factor (ECF subfamily)
VSEPSEALDLVQEVYLRLLKLERPELIRSPRAYVFRVAANIAREHWLKRASEPTCVELVDGVDEASPAPDDWAVTLERLRQLAMLLGELSPNVGAAILWAHRDGHTYEEIGERLAVSRNRVKKYLARALAHCRKHVSDR